VARTRRRRRGVQRRAERRQHGRRGVRRGLTPEAADQPTDGEDADYVEAPAQTAVEANGAAETGSAVDDGVRDHPRRQPDLETSTSEVTTEYYCPECEMTRAADGNSMRAGDICPECKRGYVDERPI